MSPTSFVPEATRPAVAAAGARGERVRHPLWPTPLTFDRPRPAAADRARPPPTAPARRDRARPPPTAPARRDHARPPPTAAWPSFSSPAPSSVDGAPVLPRIIGERPENCGE